MYQNNKRKTKLILVFISVALIGYYYFKPDKNRSFQDEKVVEVETVKRGAIQETADIIGTIRSSKQTLLTAKSKGILLTSARSGERIKKGALLANIDNQDVEQNYRLLKETEEIARIQYERLHSLLKSGVMSKSGVEEKKALLLEAQKKLSDAKIAMEELKIYAPFDGVLGFFIHGDGSQVSIGDPIVHFYDPQSLLVEFDLPLTLAKAVHDGSSVWINQALYQLTHIQKMLDEDTHMCPAYVNIECPNCIIGTTTNVTLTVNEKPDAIVIPFEAVFLREGNPFVYIVKENKSILTPVTLGLRDKTRVEVTHGLKEGDQLIIYGHSRLYPDAPVKIHV